MWSLQRLFNPGSPPPGCLATRRMRVKWLLKSLTSVCLPSMNFRTQICVCMCMIPLQCPLLTVHSCMGGSGVCNYAVNKIWKDSACLPLVSPFLFFSSICLSADTKDTLHHFASCGCVLAFCYALKKLRFCVWDFCIIYSHLYRTTVSNWKAPNVNSVDCQCFNIKRTAAISHWNGASCL